MLFNLLILFLCTGCSACGDYCLPSMEGLYFKLVDKETGENAIIKYGISDSFENRAYLTDDFDNIINTMTVTPYSWNNEPPYLFIGIEDEEYIDYANKAEGFKLWLKDVYIGTFALTTKKSKDNITSCCSSYKITKIDFVEPNIEITKKTNERGLEFYEIQF